jgi:hypothetical protein
MFFISRVCTKDLAGQSLKRWHPVAQSLQVIVQACLRLWEILTTLPIQMTLTFKSKSFIASSWTVDTVKQLSVTGLNAQVTFHGMQLRTHV